MEQLKTIRNGAKVRPTFSAGETRRRLDQLRRHVDADDLGACLLTPYHNVNYYGDFLYCSFGRSYGLAATQRDHTTISANIDGGQPWRRSAGANLVYTDWQRDSFRRRAARDAGDGARARQRRADDITGFPYGPEHNIVAA